MWAKILRRNQILKLLVFRLPDTKAHNLENNKEILFFHFRSHNERALYKLSSSILKTETPPFYNHRAFLFSSHTYSGVDYYSSWIHIVCLWVAIICVQEIFQQYFPQQIYSLTRYQPQSLDCCRHSSGMLRAYYLLALFYSCWAPTYCFPCSWIDHIYTQISI